MPDERISRSDVTFLIGGVRSGKSSLAVGLGRRHAEAGGVVLFVACAEPFDEDMRDRIARHRVDRPDWPTVEAPIELGAAIDATDPSSLVIVDCLTVWLANLLHHDTPIEPAVASFIASLQARSGPAVIVSNEVGMGLHPVEESSRRYGDELGRLHQTVAALAGTTLLVVAGRVVRLHDPHGLL